MKYAPRLNPQTGEIYLPVELTGVDILKDSLLNKGSAFTRRDREALGLNGLLPSHVSTMEEQLERVRSQYDAKPTDLSRNIFLAGLQDRNETLFYRFLVENLEELVPIVYTPTVAEACRYWSHIFRRSRGIYVTPADRGNIPNVLRNRRIPDASVIVVTDSERILGIGDQGAGGMGIPIGKLALYTVAAGIHPSRCVPICLDVGTNNEELLLDPLYLGWRELRLRGDAYWTLVQELVEAVREVFPGALLQWEDFANLTSFRNLDTYRDVLPSFNDDIQGTAAMTVAGLVAAGQITGRKLNEQKVVIAGGGSAGVGIHRLLKAESGGADSQIFVVDSAGLIVSSRTRLADHKKEIATDPAQLAGWVLDGSIPKLSDIVRNVHPDALIGVSGIPGLFTEKLIRDLAADVDQPVVMALSNPTSHAEVTPADALAWSEGRALVATGSPFDDVTYNGRRHRIAQANNVFIFPGVGLGVLVSEATAVTTEMLLAAARALADYVQESGLVRDGRLYPPITDVRDVSRRVAREVARCAGEQGVGKMLDAPDDAIASAMWEPNYLPYRFAG